MFPGIFLPAKLNSVRDWITPNKGHVASAEYIQPRTNRSEECGNSQRYIILKSNWYADSEVELINIGLFVRSAPDCCCYKQTNQNREGKKVQRQQIINKKISRAFPFYFFVQFSLFNSTILQFVRIRLFISSLYCIFFAIDVNKFIFTLAKNKIKSKSKRQTNFITKICIKKHQAKTKTTRTTTIANGEWARKRKTSRSKQQKWRQNGECGREREWESFVNEFI